MNDSPDSMALPLYRTGVPNCRHGKFLRCHFHSNILQWDTAISYWIWYCTILRFGLKNAILFGVVFPIWFSGWQVDHVPKT